MPNPLPTPARWPCLAAPRTLAALAALLLALPRVAGAFEVTASQPREREGLLIAEARLADVLAPRVAESLARGMPATLQVHAELWRRRRAWFDKLESSADASVRIRYDVWTDRYLLERFGSNPIVVGTIDSVAVVLQRPWIVTVGRVGQLNATSTYYVALSATLRPLTVEDLTQVEGWLSGEVKDKRKSGFGVIAEIPLSLFDAVRNVAGFGDERAHDNSDDFKLRDLFPR